MKNAWNKKTVSTGLRSDKAGVSQKFARTSTLFVDLSRYWSDTVSIDQWKQFAASLRTQPWRKTSPKLSWCSYSSNDSELLNFERRKQGNIDIALLPIESYEPLAQLKALLWPPSKSESVLWLHYGITSTQNASAALLMLHYTNVEWIAHGFDWREQGACYIDELAHTISVSTPDRPLASLSFEAAEQFIENCKKYKSIRINPREKSSQLAYTATRATKTITLAKGSNTTNVHAKWYFAKQKTPPSWARALHWPLS